MMFQYELKKILRKKVNLVAMLAGYIILMITTIYPVISEWEYISYKDKELKGMEAIQYHQDFAQKQTDVLTEEYVTDVIKEIQESKADPETDEGFVKLSDDYDKLYTYLVKSYQPIGDNGNRGKTIMDVDISHGAKFYEPRIQRVKDYVNQDFSTGNFSKEEKDYWIQRAEAVKTPFLWGDTFVMNQYDTVIALVFYLMFVLVICLSSVFPSENDKGTEGLLLSTKYGQKRLVHIKALAAYAFGFAYLLIGYLIAFVWLYFNLGLQGLHLPVQLLDSTICSSVDMGQFLLLQMLISVVVCFFEISLILFVSAFTRSAMGTMALLTAVLIIPAFIPFSKESSLFNHVIAPAVVRMVDLKECMVRYMDYKVGPWIIDLPTFAIFIHMAAAMILVLVLRKTYIRRALYR